MGFTGIHHTSHSQVGLSFDKFEAIKTKVHSHIIDVGGIHVATVTDVPMLGENNAPPKNVDDFVLGDTLPELFAFGADREEANAIAYELAQFYGPQTTLGLLPVHFGIRSLRRDGYSMDTIHTNPRPPRKGSPSDVIRVCAPRGRFSIAQKAGEVVIATIAVVGSLPSVIRDADLTAVDAILDDTLCGTLKLEK